ncbi:MAG: hypothetical protein VR69_10255 [Peptococcaceae bacterium BRH_c4b]|nr:MAG: hypothetical protein VR69_10255 [Peptococcaceae bacterium BRH_c4b]
MILVLGGTAESKSLAEQLLAAGFPVLLSTATSYGARLASETGAEVVWGRLDGNELVELMISRDIRAVVDASHPFAENVSANARRACASGNVKYIRFKRKEQALPGYPLLHSVNGYKEAAELAVRLGDIIFLTTGSKTADIFIGAATTAGKRLVIRILPDPGVIERLTGLGVDAGDIVAMRGPFGYELNLALFQHYRADVLVTKESGAEGGQDKKLASAVALSMPVVLIRRPPEPAEALDSIDGIIEKLRQLAL